MRPKVSVIMAARNVAPYVEAAVRSVLAQRGVSFELLIGDDASTDATWERIRAYRQDPRVRANRFRKRRGPAEVRNRLIARARGRYLSVCDADDRMLPGNLLRLSRALDRRPAAGVAFGPVRTVTEPGAARRCGRRAARDRRALRLLFGLEGRHPGCMFRKALITRAGGYDPALQIEEDADLFLRLAEVTRFQRVRGRPLYVRRRRPGALTQGPRRRSARALRRVLRRTLLRRHRIGRPLSG